MNTRDIQKNQKTDKAINKNIKTDKAINKNSCILTTPFIFGKERRVMKNKGKKLLCN